MECPTSSMASSAIIYRVLSLSVPSLCGCKMWRMLDVLLLPNKGVMFCRTASSKPSPFEYTYSRFEPSYLQLTLCIWYQPRVSIFSSLLHLALHCSLPFALKLCPIRFHFTSLQPMRVFFPPWFFQDFITYFSIQLTRFIRLKTDIFQCLYPFSSTSTLINS